jgi:hypothetical protein
MRSQFAVNGGVALEVGNALAFVATTSQVQIIDFQNASVPVVKAIYGDGVASNGDATALRLMGSTLFLGSGSFIDSIDVSDPAHPVKMGTFTNSPLAGGWGMLPLEASGSRLYYGYWNTAESWYSGICILDASNPPQLTELGRLNLVGGPIGSIAAIGNHLYVTTVGDMPWMWSVQIIDVTDAVHPRLVRRIGISEAPVVIGVGGAQYLTRRGNYAYLSGSANLESGAAVSVLDVRNPEQPTVVSRIESSVLSWRSRILMLPNNQLLWCGYDKTQAYELTNVPSEALGFTYTTNNGTITITGYSGSDGALSIPSSTNGLPITSIGEGAFSWCFGLTSVTIPNTVTNIGTRAFSSCQNLTNVAMGEGIGSIGSYAFCGCRSLRSLTIPSAVTSIGDYAFAWCGMTNVTIPSDLRSIREGVFTGTSLTSITIPNSVTSIGNWAFYECRSLTRVTLGNSVTSIGVEAFSYCTSLTGVYFQGNPPDQGWDGAVFHGSTSVTVYYLPGTIGWPDTFDDRPAVLWLPEVVTNDVGFGVQTNQFGFNIIWASNRVVVVEASTTLSHPAWSPVITNTLTDGWSYFSDAEWTNYPARFYRVRSQ